jgi:hypothetical protein
MILRRAFSVMLCVILGAQMAACSVGDALALSDDTYVRVMAELLAVSDFSAGESADSARAAVLERIGVSEEQVLAFAEGAGRDPERMERLWTAIQALVDSAQVAGDSSASAPLETRFGSVVTGGAPGDSAAQSFAPDTAGPAVPPALADSAKIRAIRERLRPRGTPSP